TNVADYEHSTQHAGRHRHRPSGDRVRGILVSARSRRHVEEAQHMSASILLSAIAPVILVLASGFAAGKHHRLSAEQATGLSRLALTYALPAALFLSMAHFDRALLVQQVPVAVVMLIGYSGLYLLLYWLLRVLGMNKLKAALLGYTFASTAVPIYGLTVLVPIYGEEIAAGVFVMSLCVTHSSAHP